MSISFIISTLLVLFIHGGLTIECPNSPSKWCDNRETAHACGVCKQKYS